MSGFTIEIASAPDREKLVAEIWHSEKLVAEINQEKGNLEIEFYELGRISFSLDEFMNILEAAKKELKED